MLLRFGATRSGLPFVCKDGTPPPRGGKILGEVSTDRYRDFEQCSDSVSHTILGLVLLFLVHGQPKLAADFAENRLFSRELRAAISTLIQLHESGSLQPPKEQKRKKRPRRMVQKRR